MVLIRIFQSVGSRDVNGIDMSVSMDGKMHINRIETRKRLLKERKRKDEQYRILAGQGV